jgi:hypothetical protein
MFNETAAQTPSAAVGSQMQSTPSAQSLELEHWRQQAFCTVCVTSGRHTPPLAQSAEVVHAVEQTPGMSSKF